MTDEENKIPLVVLLGPTAVGKTEIAIDLAEEFQGEIVSADSRLFYRGMDIGTAKPTQQQRSRVPHHLIDVAFPDETWSLALFQEEANRTIREIVDRHHLPFLVGGTGQFQRAIIEGWKIPPAHPDAHLRAVLESWGKAAGALELHAALSKLDPQSARSIDPSNVRRTVRALEVILSTGKRFSEQRLSGVKLFEPLLLGLTLPRAELYRRIDERIERMIEGGLIDEVRRLIGSGYAPDLPTMSAIGYREISEHLQGKISLDEAKTLMKRRTRVFVRRQANWFKESDPEIHWFRVNGGTSQEMTELIKNWLKSIHWGENPRVYP